MRRSHWPVLALACVLAAGAPAPVRGCDLTGGSTRPTPLGALVARADSIFLLRVREVDRDAGVITFRRGEVLKGKQRRGTFRHVVSAELLPREECADLLAWAGAGRLAVCFWTEKEHLVCVGNHWYRAAEEGGKEWSANPVPGCLETTYSGPVEKLRDAVADVLAGKEVTVTALVPDEAYHLAYPDTPVKRDWVRGQKGRVWRVGASLAIKDAADVATEDSRHFVGWGVGDKEEVPALVASLKAADAHARAEAAEDLGQVGPAARSAAGALRRALEDADPFVRVAAAKGLALVNPDDRAALPALVGALKEKDGQVRAAAAGALAAAGRPAGAAAGELRSALREDPDERVRRCAAFALGQAARGGHLNAEERAAAVAALAAVLRDDRDRGARQRAVRALLGFGPDAKPAVAELGQTLRAGGSAGPWALEGLARLGPDGLPGLIAALRLPADAHQAVIADCVGEMGPPAREAVPALRDLLDAEDPAVCCAAVLALLRIDPRTEAEFAVPAAVRIVEDNQSWFGHRRRLCESLGELGPGAGAAVPALVAALHDKEEDIRYAAAWALGCVGPDAAAAAALAEALADKDPNVRLAAARSLWHAGQRREALAALTLLLRRPGHRFVGVLGVVADIGPDAAALLPELQRMLRDPDADHRPGVALAVWRVARREEVGAEVHDPRQEALSVLIALVRSRDPNDRVDAARVLAEIGADARRAVPALVEALRDEEPGVRGYCADALASMGPAAAEAADALAELFGREKGYGRVVAASALASVGRPSPEAAAYLTTFLERHPAEAARVVPVLGECGPAAKAAVPLLLRYLTDEDRAAYLAAAKALPRIDPEAARKAGLPPTPEER
jgi:HEAT repeat protein